MSVSIPRFGGRLHESFELHIARLSSWLAVHAIDAEDERMHMLRLSLFGVPELALFTSTAAPSSFEAAVSFLSMRYSSSLRAQCARAASLNALAHRAFKDANHPSETVADFVDEVSLNLALASIERDEAKRDALRLGFRGFPVCSKLLARASTFDSSILEALRWEAMVIARVNSVGDSGSVRTVPNHESIADWLSQEPEAESLADPAVTAPRTKRSAAGLHSPGLLAPTPMSAQATAAHFENIVNSAAFPARRSPSIRRVPPPTMDDIPPMPPSASSGAVHLLDDPPTPQRSARLQQSHGSFDDDDDYASARLPPPTDDPRAPEYHTARTSPTVTLQPPIQPNLYNSLGPRGEHAPTSPPGSSGRAPPLSARPRKLKRKGSTRSRVDSSAPSTDDEARTATGPGEPSASRFSRFIAGSLRRARRNSTSSSTGPGGATLGVPGRGGSSASLDRSTSRLALTKTGSRASYSA